MKKIALRNRGGETVAHATIDDADSERLMKYRWHLHHTGYARTSVYVGGGRMRRTVMNIPMHVMLMESPGGHGIVVDHINGDRLDNRRSNLRLCSDGENVQNARLRVSNTSGFRGVSWNKEMRKWRARISAGGRRFLIGDYADVIEAAQAYDDRARELYGQFARLNFGA